MLESAQMVAWIKSDDESAQKANTTYALIFPYAISSYKANIITGAFIYPKIDIMCL
jgi:hypothetical protein